MELESASYKTTLNEDGKENATMENVPTLSAPSGVITNLQNVPMEECAPTDTPEEIALVEKDNELAVCAIDIQKAIKNTATAEAAEIKTTGEAIVDEAMDSVEKQTIQDTVSKLSDSVEIISETNTAAKEDCLNNSVEIIGEASSTANEDSANKSVEVINENSPTTEEVSSVTHSAVQIESPNGVSNERVPEGRLESEVMAQRDIGKLSDADVMEVMDITQTEMDVNDTHEVQLVCEEIIKEKSTIKQKTVPQDTPTKALANTSLGLLSQYGSDTDDAIDSDESETMSVIAVPVTANKSYRTQVVEIDSESDADTNRTISSDTESEDESSGYLAKIAKVINKRIGEKDDDDDDDDEDGDGDAGEDDEENEKNEGEETKKRGRRKPPRVRGEMLLDDLPPIQDLQISVPAEECIEFGRVHSIVDQLLLVSALPNAILLDLETVLFLEQGKRVLGEVFDVLGQVADPLYCVRFNTNEHIHKKGINVGDIVYVAPKTDYTQYVILSSLMKMRGSDASWENDIEPPPRYIDYSDDEEEREARYQLRKQRRQRIKEEEGEEDDDDDDEDEVVDDDGNNNNNKNTKAKKRSRMHTTIEGGGNAAARRGRRERPTFSGRQNTNVTTGGSNNNMNRRPQQQRYGSNPYGPRSYQPHHDSSSWHSNYNQQYHNNQQQHRPPAHVYRSPYPGPYQYQRPPMYRTPPPHAPFHPYMHPPPAMHSMPPPQMSPTPPPSHGMPPPSQMTPPPHSMPPQMSTPPLSMHTIPTSQQMAPPPHSMAPHSPRQIAQSPMNIVPNPLAFETTTKSKTAKAMQKDVEPAPPGAD